MRHFLAVFTAPTNQMSSAVGGSAVRYVQEFKAIQSRLHEQEGSYAPLARVEATGSLSAPFGFVPRLTLDRWSYVVILKDGLDPCGFALFTDQDSVIYNAHPVIDRRSEQPHDPER
jgi:hypothetical protein